MACTAGQCGVGARAVALARRWRFNPPQALAEGLAKEWTRRFVLKPWCARHRVSLTHASRTARLEALEATYHMTPWCHSMRTTIGLGNRWFLWTMC